MSAWDDVMTDLAAHGGTPSQVAARVGLPTQIVESIIDHASRLGLVQIGSQCGSACAPVGVQAGPACAGCPVRPRG